MISKSCCAASVCPLVACLGAAAVGWSADSLRGESLLTLPASLRHYYVAQATPEPSPPVPGADATRESVKTPTEPASIASPGMSETATFALSSQRLHNDPTILWPGFMTGLRGFEHFYEPVGMPLYFESPFNTTQLRLLYLYHDFPNGSQIGGGHLNVYAAQIRLALTERLGFIATKDGYSDLNAGILPESDGWNDFAIGLKYVLIADRERDFVLATGLRWEWQNGDRDVLQGADQELSPFFSFAQGFDQFHILGNITGRIPTDLNDGNCILSWNLHFDYEILPQILPGLAPLIEFHGLHYLSDGDRLPLSVGGLDYTNLGSADVAGDTVIWSGVGFRWKLTPHVSLGSTFEFPLTDADDDIMGNRVTADLAFSW
ncbi:MAG: hypothetical protein AB7Q17_06405 [Phycisphaerae bacterium]